MTNYQSTVCCMQLFSPALTYDRNILSLASKEATWGYFMLVKEGKQIPSHKYNFVCTNVDLVLSKLCL